jgi:hypothetical protein
VEGVGSRRDAFYEERGRFFGRRYKHVLQTVERGRTRLRLDGIGFGNAFAEEPSTSPASRPLSA